MGSSWLNYAFKLLPSNLYWAKDFWCMLLYNNIHKLLHIPGDIIVVRWSTWPRRPIKLRAWLSEIWCLFDIVWPCINIKYWPVHFYANFARILLKDKGLITNSVTILKSLQLLQISYTADHVPSRERADQVKLLSYGFTFVHTLTSTVLSTLMSCNKIQLQFIQRRMLTPGMGADLHGWLSMVMK